LKKVLGPLLHFSHTKEISFGAKNFFKITIHFGLSCILANYANLQQDRNHEEHLKSGEDKERQANCSDCFVFVVANDAVVRA
jgi:hypothetical protein